MHNILLPSKLKVISEDTTNGIYEIEGLYPGYGHTLGNSLRRIILSSLPGAAITTLKIDGAQHEFSTLEGVKEDVITLILNLKKVRFSLLTEEPQSVTLDIKGPHAVTAKDITTSGQVEVLTPDQYIGEVTGKNGHLKVEMTIERGLGFVSRESRTKEKADIGAILVDAIFTPIRKVSYEVENMRVGDRTDHNRLRVNIQTDGTLSPREAFERSIKIMVEQLRSILDLKEEAQAMAEPAPQLAEAEGGEEDEEAYTEALKTRIDTLQLSTRTLNALNEANIRTVGGLVKKKAEDLLELEGFGKKGLSEIEKVLEGFGLELKK